MGLSVPEMGENANENRNESESKSNVTQIKYYYYYDRLPRPGLSVYLLLLNDEHKYLYIIQHCVRRMYGVHQLTHARQHTHTYTRTYTGMYMFSSSSSCFSFAGEFCFFFVSFAMKTIKKKFAVFFFTFFCR